MSRISRWTKAIKDDWQTWQEQRKIDSPIVQAIGFYCKVVKSISPFALIVTASAKEHRLALSDALIAVWTVLLGCLFFIPPASAHSLTVAILITAIAGFRVLDILSYTLDMVRLIAHRVDVYDVARSALLNLFNVLHIVLAFGLIDFAWLTRADFVGNGPSVNEAFSYLYLSWTTLFTVGSGFTPSTMQAQALVMAEVGTGLVIIALSLAIFVGNLRIKGGGTASLYQPRGEATNPGAADRPNPR
jgi:hypothetical protein